MAENRALTISQINRRINDTLMSEPALQNVWVVGETLDVRVAGGNCYLELCEKDASGRQVAKVRANIWNQTYCYLYHKFMQETGQQFRTDLKVMVLVSVTYHQIFGLSLNIRDINSAYTLGGVQQRRNEILRRLQQEGILEMNRRLPWPAVPQRIAVISAGNAAGYGDFINQLYSNPLHLRFTTRLFPAMMQGERAVPTIIAALEAIAAESEMWDGVVIIRGGGATADLLVFDNYDLAANIAQFPLPVIVGIGHERDITVLDWVANMRVKTPTAAAQWLVGQGENALATLQTIAAAMLRAVTDKIGACNRRLATISGTLPAACANVVNQARSRLANAAGLLGTAGDRRLRPEHMRLDNCARSLAAAVDVALERQRRRIDSAEQLVNALSPQATLRRGYSITRVAGHAVRSAADIPPGEVVETLLADGSLLSKVLGTADGRTL